MKIRSLTSLLLFLGSYSANAQCIPPTMPVVSNDTTICEYSTVMLSVSGNLNDATDWYWYSGSCGGSLEGTGPWLFVYPSVTTVYYVRGEGGCVSPGSCATVTVTVLPRPTANNSGEVDSPTDCGASNGSIIGISATGIGPFFYSWDSGPFTSSSSLTGAGFGSHWLEIKDANGCSATFIYDVYNPAPPVITSSVTINKPSCGVSNGSITGVTATGTPTVTYSWDNGTTYSTNSTLSGVTAGIYTVSAKDGHNCTSSMSFTISSTSGTAPSAPNIGGVPSQICYGSSTTLTVVNPPAGSTYLWTSSTGLTGTGTSFIINNVNPSGANAYGVFVMMTDINGCQNSSSTNFTVNPLPTLDVSSPASGCAPVCVSLYNSSSATGTCSWNFGDGSNTSNCTPTHCYNQAGRYYAVLQMTDANGCTNQDSTVINVFPIPTASFIASPQTTTLANPTINFTDLSSGASLAAWNWNFGTLPTNTSTLQNPTFIYQDTGTYYVTLYVTSSNGCVDSIVQSVRIDPAIGINYHSFGGAEFYPNPADQNIVIKSRTSIGYIAIRNNLGEIIYRTFSNRTQDSFDVSAIPPGVYVLDHNGSFQKFIKN